MTVRTITEDSMFQTELSAAGMKLVVAYFTASWCGPCQQLSPFFDQLPSKYPAAIFLKIDVQVCQDTADSQTVSSVPTIIFFRNRIKIDRLQGVDPQTLVAKIQQHIGAGSEETSEDYGQGLMDLNTFIMQNQCECLNESDDHPAVHAFKPNGGFLQSDVDEQLIISVTFNQSIKLHSLKIKAPIEMGPKEIKIFINQPRTIDFDMAESMTSVQDLVVSPKDLEGNPISLRYVKFQNIQNIQIFVRNNQSSGEMTQIDYLGFIGSPLATTKMDDFKRVAGKKGESH